MDLKIDMLDLCKEVGGMYNAVELLSDLLKTHKIFYRESYEEIPAKKEYDRAHLFKHEKIHDEYDNDKGDCEAINFNHGSYSYGYLKTRETKLTFKIKDIEKEEEVLKIFKEFKKKEKDRKKRNKEMSIKMLDVDPYGEENWLDEKLVKRFKEFVNEGKLLI